MTKHIQYKHEGVKYACNQCNYQATQQGHMRRHIHRRSWVIFRGGPTIPSCQNSIPSCQNFFPSGGGQVCQFWSAMLSYSAKLFCQWANIAGEWLQNGQKLKQPKVAENRQK